MSKVWNRVYRLSVIEQKVEYTSSSAPPNIKQGFYSAWKTPPVAPDLAGIPQVGGSGENALKLDTGGSTQVKTLSGGDSVLISGLHMTADIQAKAAEGESAKSVIRVFNASKDTRSKLERKNAYVILEAGYGDDYGIVFTGSVLKAFSRKSGTEMITELVCVDSNVQLKTSRVSYSWPPNTSYATIINDVAASMQKQGVAKGFIETNAKNLPSLPSPAETKATGGFTFQGLTSQLLDKLCEQFSYSWFIVLNELYIQPKSFNSYTVVYDMSNSLVKSFEPEQDTAEETPNVETKGRFRMSTFLDHRIKIGQRVRLTEGQYKGLYKVVSVDTSLSYLDGGAWDSNILLEAV
jgi:hypothetical protein